MNKNFVTKTIKCKKKTLKGVKSVCISNGRWKIEPVYDVVLYDKEVVCISLENIKILFNNLFTILKIKKEVW